MRHIVIGTAGHIDHGKSALVEALTGVDPDRLKEEKARGITIDLGFAHYMHDETDLAFVDVPGHERFVRNMLAGASGIDCLLLVIAADESVMPQTREHFDICELLGVHSGVVALTKSDLVDAETLEIVRLETRELVAGSFLESATMVPVSARTGAGIDALREALARLADTAPCRSDEGVARLPIDRAFSVKGFGTVITGTQVSGRIRKDTDLTLLPADRRIRVRGLQVHSAAQSTSQAGQRVAVNLMGVEVAELQRGDTLTEVGGLEVTRRADGIIGMLKSARALKHGARVRFHQGTSEVMARVALGANVAAAEPAPDDDAALQCPAELDSGDRAYARLHLERPVALTRGDRFVLRAYSPPLTIAGGVVLDPRPPRGRLRSWLGQARLARLARLDDPAGAARVLIEEAQGNGISRGDLTTRAGMPLAGVAALSERLEADGWVESVRDRLVSSDHVREIASTLLKAVTAFHRERPLEPGLPREEARVRLRRCAAPPVFDHVVQRLVSDGTLVATGYLALTSHQISLSADEQRVRDALDQLFRDAGLSPPDGALVANVTAAAGDVVDRMTRLLMREGRLEKVDALVFHADALARLRREVAALKSDTEEAVSIDVATFKNRYAVTRKFAIPLLEYLDRVRITRRVGRDRVVL